MIYLLVKFGDTLTNIVGVKLSIFWLWLINVYVLHLVLYSKLVQEVSCVANYQTNLQSAQSQMLAS